ncbi:hypothetical protein [Aurantibacillus circumpalustris]|uniref:hypothetical protein n=1 Tax=Aurantibacillus circumpalustris TaxID=3036359 RepID=UPI00295B9214|nr:hypothetical protein [Aurantibacillus circumpalustris]
MKNTIIIISLFFAFTFNVKGQTNSYKLKFDSLSCLLIEGKIMNAYEGTDGVCMIELISANEVLESIMLKEGKDKFKFALNKNMFYSIRVSKTGFATKLISVNTEMLTGPEGVHVFKFETSLIKDKIAAKLNQDILDFPVTIIHFDYEKDCFVHNAVYTSYIKKELYKVGPVKIQTPKHAYVTDISDLASNSK